MRNKRYICSHTARALAACLCWLLHASAGLAAEAAPSNPQTYSLEADVSMRSIRVDVAFSGARLVLFGAVSRPPGLTFDTHDLDVVAVIESARTNLTVRRKSRVLGLWLNTDAVTFGSAPRYYAVVSTRPPEAFASKALLAELGIGAGDVPLSPIADRSSDVTSPETDAFRRAAITLGAKGRHFVHLDTALSFVGSSLFRGEVDLPGTIPIGELDVRVYLIGGGAVLARHDTHLGLEREGFENVMYTFAHQHAVSYGIATVLMSVGIGLVASFLAGRRSR